MKFANGLQDGNLAKRRHIQSNRKKESKNYQRDVENRKQRYNQKVMKERRTTVSRNGLSNNQTNITQVSQ